MSQTKVQLISTVVPAGVNFSGIITASSFVGNVTGDATGLSGTPNITVGTVTGNLTGNVTGNATGLSGTPNVTVGTIGATSLNASGVITSTTLNSTNGTITNLTGTAGTITTLNVASTLNALTGIVTNTSGTNLNYSGIGTITTLNTTNLAPTNINSSGVATLTTLNVTNSRPTNLNVSGVSTLTNTTGTNLNFTGIITAAGGFNLGISSAGTTITSGPVKTLNFVGTGNTFAVNGTSVDISISGGSGGSGGIGTALSQDQTSPLNKIYFTDQVLSIGSTITVNPPDSSNIAYTQYAEIAVEQGYDLIVGDGDDLIPDILGLSTVTAAPLSGAGGRVRADQFTNKAGTGAPTFPLGLTIGDGGTFDSEFFEVPNVLDVTDNKTITGSTTSTVTVMRKSVVVANTKSLILGPDCELVINALQI